MNNKFFFDLKELSVLKMDPFEFEEDLHGLQSKEVHIRVFQRTARKTITLVEGLEESLDLKKMVNFFKKNFNCNGSIKKECIQLSGDQRENVSNFLISEKIVEKDKVKMHGY